MPFTFKQLEIPEVILVEPKLFHDDRGFFAETFKTNDFKANGIDVEFVQDNHSNSGTGVLRGLHYQKNPNAQGKLVRVVKGGVFDVAVDIRKGSPTYGKWVGAELTSKNHHMLWVPPGFAHGFLVLEDDTHVLYKVSGNYSPQDDRQIRWNDPDFAIKWPVKGEPALSDKDAKAPFFKEADNNFEYRG